MPRRKVLGLSFVIEWYLKGCRGRACGPRTIRSYERKLQAFQTYLAQVYQLENIGEVTEAHVAAFLTSLDVSDVTRLDYLYMLYRFFRWCLWKAYIGSNPTKKVLDAWRQREQVKELS